jgi:hypothetical protein
LTLPPPIVPFPDDQKRIYQALGQALARWQYIESGLFLVAFGLMGTDQKICSLTFFQIKSAENKLSFVERLSFHKLSQHTRTKFWKPIADDIGKAIKFRNAMAHFEVSFLNNEGFDKIKPKSKHRYIISSHHLDEHEKRSGSTKALTVESLDDISEYFRIISYKLVYFVVDHLPNVLQQEASLEPRFQHWLAQFHKTERPQGFEPPQQSSHPKEHQE